MQSTHVQYQGPATTATCGHLAALDALAHAEAQRHANPLKESTLRSLGMPAVTWAFVQGCVHWVDTGPAADQGPHRAHHLLHSGRNDHGGTEAASDQRLFHCRVCGWAGRAQACQGVSAQPCSQAKDSCHLAAAIECDNIGAHCLWRRMHQRISTSIPCQSICSATESITCNQVQAIHELGPV